jgi:hypothetical protein
MAHGLGFQVLFLIDNSQGHLAYSENALLVSRMNVRLGGKNVRPGGKQACMRDGWFIQDGERIIQPMTFPPNDSHNLNTPKGIKAVLVERDLYQTNLRGKCEKKCESNACCNKWILEIQPDFAEQKSLVQETI